MYKLLISTMLALLCVSCGGQRPFDSAAWQAPSEGEANNRFLMADSLAERLKSGMPQSKVRNLLGKPDIESGKHPDWFGANSPYDAYEIRFYYNMMDFDTDYFIIDYDSELKTHSTRIETIQG